MQLKNLMSVADNSISMVLTGIRPDNVEIGYDFKNKKWLDNSLFSPDRIITVGEFVKSVTYMKCKNANMDDFSTMKIKNVSSLKDVKVARGRILIVKITLSCEKFPDMKQFTKKAMGIFNKKSDKAKKRRADEKRKAKKDSKKIENNSEI